MAMDLWLPCIGVVSGCCCKEVYIDILTIRVRIRIRNRNGDFYFAQRAPKLRYYGDVIHSFYWKSAAEHDGGV